MGVSALHRASARACYVPLAHKAGEDDLFGAGALAEGQMDRWTARSTCCARSWRIRPILKIGQNLKYDWKILRRYGIDVGPA